LRLRRDALPAIVMLLESKAKAGREKSHGRKGAIEVTKGARGAGPWRGQNPRRASVQLHRLIPGQQETDSAEKLCLEGALEVGRV
jgi:hypothetical protein